MRGFILAYQYRLKKKFKNYSSWCTFYFVIILYLVLCHSCIYLLFNHFLSVLFLVTLSRGCIPSFLLVQDDTELLFSLCFLLHQLFATSFPPLTVVRAAACRWFRGVSEHGSIYYRAKSCHVTVVKVRVHSTCFTTLSWLKANLIGLPAQLTDNFPKCLYMSTENSNHPTVFVSLWVCFTFQWSRFIWI